jgi:hypothetical protein
MKLRQKKFRPSSVNCSDSRGHCASDRVPEIVAKKKYTAAKEY